MLVGIMSCSLFRNNRSFPCSEIDCNHALSQFDVKIDSIYFLSNSKIMIEGVVKDNLNKSVLPIVKILLANTNNIKEGVITTEDGVFKLTVDDITTSDYLNFNVIGYKELFLDIIEIDSTKGQLVLDIRRRDSTNCIHP